MISAVLNLPVAVGVAVVLLFFGATAAALYLLFFHSPARHFCASLTGVVAPFFGAVSVLFALLTGFLANDVGDRNKEAVRAVTAEADGIRSLHTLSTAPGAEMAAVRQALRTYVETAIKDEWPRMDGHETSPATNAAMSALTARVSDQKIGADAGASVHNAMLGTLIRIRTARVERLSLSTDQTNDIKWATVLFLGIITQISIALVHVEKRRAMAVALGVFSVAAAVTLSLIAMQEWPFEGPLRVSPAPLEAALTTISLSSVPPDKN